MGLFWKKNKILSYSPKNMGPVVQSIVSLTSSLRGQVVKCFNYDFITKYTEIFCQKKWEKLLHCKSFSHFFNKKCWRISDINVWNSNETLTNDVVSFEQPGHGIFSSRSSDYGTTYSKVDLPADATVTHMYSSTVNRQKVLHMQASSFLKRPSLSTSHLKPQPSHLRKSGQWLFIQHIPAISPTQWDTDCL